jgi:signal transduction histidine kinase
MKWVKASLFLWLLTNTVFGQGPGDHSSPGASHYVVKQYNSEDGLPQNSAKDLLLDPNHFLWISTESGLVRFDGQRFRIYNSTTIPGLRSDRFDVLSLTSNKEILLTTGFDISLIYKVTPDYKVVQDTTATLLKHKFISHYSNGLFDVTPLFDHYSRIKTNCAADTALLLRLCNSTSYWTMNEHEIIIRQLNDFFYLNNATEEVIKLPVGLKRTNTQAGFLKDTFFFLDDQGKAVFFKNGREINIRPDSTVSRIWKIYEPSPVPDFYIGTKGEQTIMRDRSDIYELTIADNVLKATLIFDGLHFLDDIAIRSFQYDKKDQRLFIGTLNAGLFVISRQEFRTLTFSTKDLNDNIFMAFQLLPAGKIITGNGILDKNEGHPGNLFQTRDRPDGHCIYKASDHSIWVSHNKQLLIYDSNFSRVLYQDSTAIDSRIESITTDHSGGTWIATNSSLFKMDKIRPHPILFHYPAFVRHSIETFMEVTPGVLWIATSNGIYTYDISLDRVSEKPVLPNVYARDIFRAKDNSVWIGTYGQGFLKYEKGKFIAMPLDPKKYLATTHSFLEDDLGFFWISTNHGIFRIKKEDLDRVAAGKADMYSFYYYDKSSGFNSNEFNGGCVPAGLKDNEGNFYFPSLNGIVCFNANGTGSEFPVDPIFIDKMVIDSISPSDKNQIRIKPDFNHIALDVSTPFYGLEDNLRLEYRLEPIDKGWNPIGRDGRIVINRLLPGKYVLTIRKPMGWGPDNFSRSGISFEILPHWYNTKLFTALLALLLIGLVFLLLWVRTRILLRQNIRLQTKVDERTMELEQSTILKERLISVIMHDLRSPLFSQAMLTNYLYENHQSLDQAEINDILGSLKDASSAICQFSTDFLVWYDSQKQGFVIRKEKIELLGFAKGIGGFYADMAARKGISLAYAIPPDLVLTSDKNILSIIIRNLVDNAVKYTRSGTVVIQAEQAGQKLRILIRDTGAGMSTTKISEILSYSDPDAEKAFPTFGYRFVTQFIRKLGGELSIESQLQQGTSIIIDFKT